MPEGKTMQELIKIIIAVIILLSFLFIVWILASDPYLEDLDRDFT